MQPSDEIVDNLKGQIKEVPWSEVSPYNDKGRVYLVDSELDIAEVGQDLVLDREGSIKEHINNGLLVVPSKEEAELWQRHQIRFRSVTIEPYVLIQQI